MYAPGRRDTTRLAREVVACSGQRPEGIVGPSPSGWTRAELRVRWFRARVTPVFHPRPYVCQLFDAKGSVDLETIRSARLTIHGAGCGATLARARSGDAAIGRGATFGKAMLAFADAYADQTEHDHARLVEAITDGVIPAEEGI